MPVKIEEKNLWERRQSLCCMVLILFSYAWGENNITSRATPTDTYQQTKQKDLTVFTVEYQTEVFEQMDMKWDVFTLEYSSDHSGGCMKSQIKREQMYYYIDHQNLVLAANKRIHT